MKNRRLTFKFTMMFLAFTILTLGIGSVLSYQTQVGLYKTQREESIRYVASYLEEVKSAYTIYRHEYYLDKFEQARDRFDLALEYWEKTSAAIGYAVYNPEFDNSYENIFKRADNEMYKNKKEMKAIRE